MRKVLVTAALLSILSAAPARADRTLDAFSAKAASSCIDFSYSFTVKADVPMSGSGTGTVRGGGYHVTGNGLDIWCDGTRRWMVDKGSKEVIIESADDAGDAFTINPALFLTDLKSSFNEVSAGESLFRGRTYHCVTLSPKVSGSVAQVKLYFSGSELKGASVKLKDGTVAEFELSGVRFSDTEKAFTFDVKALDKSWVITDLSDF